MKKALIIDDEKVTIDLLKWDLKARNYEIESIKVDTYMTFNELLEEKKEIFEKIKSYTLIITDFQMGKITGKNIITFLENNNFKGKIICFSGAIELAKKEINSNNVIFISKSNIETLQKEL